MNKASGSDFIKMGMGAFCTLKWKNSKKRRIVDARNYGFSQKKEKETLYSDIMIFFSNFEN